MLNAPLPLPPSSLPPSLPLQVAQFLRVNLETGLFFFDASYRPVPLAQQYIGVSERNFTLRNTIMHEIAYTKVGGGPPLGAQGGAAWDGGLQ